MFVCCCDNLRRQESKMQSFSELSISPSLKERLKAARFSVPTPVQAAAIPQALAGKDVIATEEHTSELQSPCKVVCRLLLEKKIVLRQPEELVLDGDEEVRVGGCGA